MTAPAVATLRRTATALSYSAKKAGWVRLASYGHPLSAMQFTPASPFGSLKRERC
jgi:hypothetical protein